MSRVVVNEIEAKVGNDVKFNSNIANPTTVKGEGTATTNLQQGLVKYWVFFRNMSILDSFNSASFTDNGTGDATLTITNVMGNINYGVNHGADGGAGTDGSIRYIEGMDGTTAKSATAYRTRCGYFTADAFVKFDDGDNTASFVGDLA